MQTITSKDNPKIKEAAKLVQIDHLLERKPNELSGGRSSVLPSPEP